MIRSQIKVYLLWLFFIFFYSVIALRDTALLLYRWRIYCYIPSGTSWNLMHYKRSSLPEKKLKIKSKHHFYLHGHTSNKQKNVTFVRAYHFCEILFSWNLASSFLRTFLKISKKNNAKVFYLYFCITPKIRFFPPRSIIYNTYATREQMYID